MIITRRLNFGFKLLFGLCLAVIYFSHGLQAQSPIKIMPLGDSITGSPGCWRALLWNSLQNSGYTNIDFVGTLPPQGCSVEHDGDNEGHGGYLATNVARQNQLVNWLSASNPDIVMMHFGTNDVWNAIATNPILDAYSILVQQMRDNNPRMKIIVAQIIPMDPVRSCSDCDLRVINLNRAIPAWAAEISTPQSPVVVVDQWTGFNTDQDTYDGVHPNDSGIEKISTTWFPVLTKLLDSDSSTPLPPRAFGQNVRILLNQNLDITLAGSDPDGQIVSYQIVSHPVSGSLRGEGQNMIYIPHNDFVGIDSFQFTVTDSDGLTSTPATVEIVVAAEELPCTIGYNITNDWGNGYQVDMQITNNSNATINGYELVWNLGMGESFAEGWNASFTINGTQVTAAVFAGRWNATILPNGGRSSFGLIVNKSDSSTTTPTTFVLNGKECAIEP